MKFRKLFLSAATGCLLVGASGAAMAQEDVDCTLPIINQTVNSITSTGEICSIRDSVIMGDVIITDSPSTRFWANEVFGRVQIVRGIRATVILNVLRNVDNTLPHRVDAGDLRIVAGNVIAGSLSVNNNLAALVEENVVGGDLQCLGNGELDAAGNEVGGEEDCTESADL